MAKVVQLLCAERVIQEVGSGNISLISLLNQIKAVSFPAFLSNFSVFVAVERDENDESPAGEVKIKIYLNNKPLFEPTLSYNFGVLKKANVIVALNGLAVYEPGTVVVSASVVGSDSQESTYSIVVELVPQTVL